jgi:hypothetical protein
MMARTVLLSSLLLLSCDPFTTTNSSVDEGNELYSASSFEEARTLYEEAREEIPERAELFYNLGTVQMALEQYDDAEVSFSRALETADEEFRPVVLSNLGLARLRKALNLESEEDRKQALVQSVEALEKAVLLRPGLETARRNLELALLHLFPPCAKREDSHEPNDRPDEATDMAEFKGEPLILCPGNKDHFKLSLSQGDRLTMTIEQDSDDKDVGPPVTELLGPEGAIVATGKAAGKNSVVIYEARVEGVHFLRVSETDDEEHPYSLTSSVLPSCESMQDGFEKNDSKDTAARLDFRQAPPPEDGSQAPPQPPRTRICPGDHDWFKVALEEHESLLLQANVQAVTGELTVEITDSEGRLLVTGARSEGGSQAPQQPGAPETESQGIIAALLDVEKSGDYFVHVRGSTAEAEAEAVLAGLIRPPCPGGDDAMEDNDSRDTAAELAFPEAPEAGANPAAPGTGAPPAPPGAGTQQQQKIEHLLRRCPADDDWFSLEVKKDQPMQLQIGFDHDRGDLNIAVFKDGEDEPVIESDESSAEQPGEGVNLVAEEDTLFHIRVAGPGDATNFYHLLVKPPDPQQGDQGDNKEDQEKEEKDQEKKEEEKKEEEKKPIEQMMDQMDKEKRPNLEAQKMLQGMPNIQAPGGKVW